MIKVYKNFILKNKINKKNKKPERNKKHIIN
jgi:hypothetical protein